MTEPAFDFAPLVAFDRIDLEEANRLLATWGHKMGPIKRPFPSQSFAISHLGRPVGVAVHACLIATTVGGIDRSEFDVNRANTVELARLCAERAGLCRVVLRLWRDFVFPTLGKRYAVSYQDADLHNGNTYRFDGWSRVGYTRSGSDQRSGRKGRNKWVWIWQTKQTHNT